MAEKTESTTQDAASTEEATTTPTPPMPGEPAHDLADDRTILEIKLRQLGEWLQDNGHYVAIVLVIATAAIIGVRWYVTSEAAAVEEGWTRLGAVMSLEEPEQQMERLEAILTDFPDRPVIAASAKLKQAEIQLKEYFDAPEEHSPETLDRIRQTLTGLLAGGDLPVLQTAQARFALAITEENAGNFDAAREQYEALISDAQFAGFPVRDRANERIEQLDRMKIEVALAPPPLIGPTLPEDLPTTQPADDEAGQTTEQPGFGEMPARPRLELGPSTQPRE